MDTKYPVYINNNHEMWMTVSAMKDMQEQLKNAMKCAADQVLDKMVSNTDQSNVINLIKDYRTLTGCTLKEAHTLYYDINQAEINKRGASLGDILRTAIAKQDTRDRFR